MLDSYSKSEPQDKTESRNFRISVPLFSENKPFLPLSLVVSRYFVSQVLKTIAQPVYDSPSFRETDTKYYFILLAESTKIPLLTNKKKPKMPVNFKSNFLFV